jgi:hypothetical protein
MIVTLLNMYIKYSFGDGGVAGKVVPDLCKEIKYQDFKEAEGMVQVVEH